MPAAGFGFHGCVHQFHCEPKAKKLLVRSGFSCTPLPEYPRGQSISFYSLNSFSLFVSLPTYAKLYKQHVKSCYIRVRHEFLDKGMLKITSDSLSPSLFISSTARIAAASGSIVLAFCCWSEPREKIPSRLPRTPTF